MKLIHISDLHLGKRLYEFSLIEDQQYIIGEIEQIIEAEQPDGILIAGDVFDKSVPSVEALALYEQFLNWLSNHGVPAFIISGNHDSMERLAFGQSLVEQAGIYLSPVYNGSIVPYTLTDSYGEVCIYLLPFLKPAHVRAAFPEEEITSYTEAIRYAISQMEIDEDKRNILVAHQFVTGAQRSDSETISVGGSDNVDESVFDGFDYVALGHIHGPQSVGRERIRYCGTPLKYSFSEASHEKSVTVIEWQKKDDLVIRTVPLKARRDMVCLKGTYEELTAKSYYEALNKDDYYQITLTDETDIPYALAKLRVIYPNLMTMNYDNRRCRSTEQVSEHAAAEIKSPQELFEDFFRIQNDRDPDAEQMEYLAQTMEKIWGDEL